MIDKITKVYDCEIKALGDRKYEFTASTGSVDRDGEVIEVEGWDLRNFKKNPVIMYAHDYRSLPIGRATKVGVSDGKLKNTVEFPPEGTYEFADIVERLVKEGYLKTESVGFIPKEWKDGNSEKSPKRTYTKQELLEISIVPVPSNPNAISDAMEAGVITAKEFKAFEDEITKPEETDDFIRIPVAECKVTATIDISKKEGISALYCGKEKKVRTYLFDKREPYNWTMARAKKWVEEHKQESFDCECIECGHKMKSEKHCAEIKCPKCGGKMRRAERPGPGERAFSQEGIIDELDYLIRCLDEVGMNEDAMEEGWNLVREIMRLSGDDIPVDIEEKVGAVLNTKNRNRLNDIKRLAQEVLDSAEEKPKPEGDEDKPKAELTQEEIIAVVKETVKDIIEKAQGKVD